MSLQRIIACAAVLLAGSASAITTTSHAHAHANKSIVDVISGAVEEVKHGIMGTVRSEVDDEYGDEMKQLREEARTSPHVRKVNKRQRHQHHRDIVTNLGAHQRELLDEKNRAARSNGDVRLMLGLTNQQPTAAQPQQKYHHEQYIADGHVYQYSVADGPAKTVQPPHVLSQKKRKHHHHKDRVVDEWDNVSEKNNDDHEDDSGEVVSYTDVKADTDGDGNHE